VKDVIEAYMKLFVVCLHSLLCIVIGLHYVSRVSVIQSVVCDGPMSVSFSRRASSCQQISRVYVYASCWYHSAVLNK